MGQPTLSENALFTATKLLCRAELRLQGYSSNAFQMLEWTQRLSVEHLWTQCGALLQLQLAHDTTWSCTTKALRHRGGHLRAVTTRACCWFMPSPLLQAPLVLAAPLTKTCMKSWGNPQQDLGFFKASFWYLLCYMYYKALFSQPVLQKIDVALKILVQMQL